MRAQDPSSHHVQTLVTPARATTGQSPILLVNGVNIIQAMEHQVRTISMRPADRPRLRQLSASSNGRAMLDGIAALYLQLDEWETDARVVQFKMPLGMLRSSIEAISGDYSGIDRLDEIAPTGKAQALRQACADGKCTLRGLQFFLHESGFLMCGAQGARHLAMARSACRAAA